ncbi:unnamed protein product [Protopolystoma xenopodis]|uniref:Uncharacterized protein n=1 Tax=Protopolystoma xenopodis TaxID=117903 RepID=A0A3S4ZV33_9PLAT|nr:unnamed protein product [Protopolystoma xenopodis]
MDLPAHEAGPDRRPESGQPLEREGSKSGAAYFETLQPGIVPHNSPSESCLPSFPIPFNLPPERYQEFVEHAVSIEGMDSFEFVHRHLDTRRSA